MALFPFAPRGLPPDRWLAGTHFGGALCSCPVVPGREHDNRAAHPLYARAWPALDGAWCLSPCGAGHEDDSVVEQQGGGQAEAGDLSLPLCHRAVLGQGPLRMAHPLSPEEICGAPVA